MDIYRRLLQYIVPHKFRLGMACLCMLFCSLFSALVSAVLYVIFNGFINQGQVTIKDLPYISYFTGGSSVTFSAMLIPFLVVGFFLFRGIFEFFSNYLMSNVGLRAVMQLRNDLYKHIARLDLDFYSKGRTGDLISRIMNDVSYIQASITDVVVDLFKQPLTILFNIPMAFYFGGKFGFISIAVFPIVTIPIIILGKRLRRVTRQMQEKFSDITSILEESFTGARIVKAFNMEGQEISKFEAVNMRVFNYFKKMLKVTIVQRPLIEVFGAFGAAFAIWFGMKTLPADRFVAFIGSMFMFYEPIKKLSKVNSSIQQSIGAGSRIFEIIDIQSAIKERRDAVHFQGPVRTVAFHNIEFHYSEGKDILKGINFNVRSGEVVAIVGPSGAGKTTLVNLIPRFYDPQKGSISINGRDIREFSVKSLRDQIGLVTQETILFNDSVHGNIAYGKPEASMEEIRRAAEMAYADTFIRELPEQYETNIGEKGNLLSGGQKQRISIARAILKNPPILILDEATSQLDTESEREVQTALENLMQGKTVFVIAHRLSTVQKADRILVLEDGGIVQEGTHDFLRGKEGVYKRLYELQ